MLSVKSITLANGLKVVHVPHDVGSITACLRGLAGSNYESPDEIGAAHVLEHLCMMQTNNRDITANGGRVTGTTSRDDVAFFAKVLKKDLAKAVSYLSEVFAQAHPNAQKLALAKNVIRHEIYQNIEDPKRHVGRISYKILYPEQRLASYNTGGVGDLEILSPETIAAFKTKHYFPANFVLSVCGNFDSDALFTLADNCFGRFDHKKKVSPLKLVPNYKAAFLVENRDNLAHLHLKLDYHGYKSGHKMKYPAYLLSIILKNRLRQALFAGNKDKAITPYILDASSFSTNSYGLFGIYTAIEAANLRSFLRIYHEINQDLCKRYVSGAELAFSKNKAQADLEFALEKTSLRADYYSELFLYDNVAKDHEEDINNFRSCSLKDISDTAKDIFSQEPKITIIDKDTSKDTVKGLYKKIFLN